MILLASDSGPIKAIEFNEGSIYMIPSKKKKKDEIKSRLKRYSETVNYQYLAHDVRNDEVHFWDRETQPSFEADGNFIYAAEVIEKPIVSLQIQKDGVGRKGTNLQVIVPYETT